MKILVITPVGHDKWNETDRKIYKSFASKDTNIDVISLPKGPDSIESPIDEYQVIPLIVEEALEKYEYYDAFIINCFLDPAVDLLKGIIEKPVIGPCEASLALASIISDKISIITVGKTGLWMIEKRIKDLGYKDILVSVKGISLTVLELDKDPGLTIKLVTEESKNAIKEGANAIILGCTGLAGISDTVQKNINKPVIDPAGAAITIAESLIKLGLKNTYYNK